MGDSKALPVSGEDTGKKQIPGTKPGGVAHSEAV